MNAEDIIKKANHIIRMCDSRNPFHIAHDRKMPFKNDMGRMWGSSRFMSPEEFKLDAVLKEITNVYTVGASAFALFANYNRNREAWILSDKLYAVALKAISDKREERQLSVRQFIEEWEVAVYE